MNYPTPRDFLIRTKISTFKQTNKRTLQVYNIGIDRDIFHPKLSLRRFMTVT